ncbi:hypothetical protein [Amycolatopsis lexingtonensis]|uniref:hypothetical protein n=1 Tax=Amycolatopsis lexingtonensis TaxID=218822 RepID=UPI003F6F767F
MSDDWHRVVPAEGRVRSVTVGGRGVALSRCGARLTLHALTAALGETEADDQRVLLRVEQDAELP